MPPPSQIWRANVPHLRHFRQRLILKAVLSRYGKDLIGIHGVERLAPEADPFIMVLNHTTWLEALLLPITFGYIRGGKLIRFLADWNFALIPGIAMILRAGETILLVRKPARPAFLNVFRPLFQRSGPAFQRAAEALKSGRSVGIFPEGTTNRHPARLLRGFDGAARLSLSTGCAVLPVGVRFPGQPPDRPVSDRAPMEVFIGEPLRPGEPVAFPARDQVRDWHARIMTEIGRLSGKQWDAGATRKKHHGFD